MGTFSKLKRKIELKLGLFFWDLGGLIKPLPEEKMGYPAEKDIPKVRRFWETLTLKDLEKYPVWEKTPWKEDVLRPMPNTVKKVDRRAGLFLIKTEFTANDGTKFYGFCSPYETYDALPEDFDSWYFDQPVIITPKGKIIFYYGANKPGKKKINSCYTNLGKDKKRLFPLHYKILVPYIGGNEYRQGIILSFMYINEKSRKAHLLK